MGRWAQYRKRGRGTENGAAAPLVPGPDYGVHWTVVQEGEDWHWVSGAGMPYPFIHFQLASAPDEGSIVAEDGTGSTGIDIDSGVTVDGAIWTRARWEDGLGNPLSVWSDFTNVTPPGP